MFQTSSSKFSKGMRLILIAASILVLAAGLDLTLLTEQTATSFAWTIQSPITAAFLGAGYLASFFLEFLAYRQKTWNNARVAVPSVFLFTTLTFIATLLHIDKFHFNSQIFTATAAAYLWLAIYIAVPIAMLILLIHQIRLQELKTARKIQTKHMDAPIFSNPRNNNIDNGHYLISISRFCLHYLALGTYPTNKSRYWSLAYRNRSYSIAYELGKQPSKQQNCIHKLRRAWSTSNNISGALHR